MRSRFKNSRSSHTRLWGIALGIGLALSSPMAASADIYLKIETDKEGGTIEGGSTEPGLEGWIIIESFSFGVERELLSDGETRSRSVAVPDCFHFGKGLDKSSPKLQEALLLGTVLPRVTLQYRTDSKDSIGNPLSIELINASFCDYRFNHVNNPPSSASTEAFSLNFEEISWVFRSPGEKANDPPVVTNFDHDATLGTTDDSRDDDGDGETNDVDKDDDNDGIPDKDEIARKMNPFVNDADKDFDKDGNDAFKEFLAGTDNDDPRSKFAIDRISLKLGEGGAPEGLVCFRTIGDRYYRLMASATGEAGSWFVVDEFTTNPKENPKDTEVTLKPGPSSNLGDLIFRVEVAKPPVAP